MPIFSNKKKIVYIFDKIFIIQGVKKRHGNIEEDDCPGPIHRSIEC